MTKRKVEKSCEITVNLGDMQFCKLRSSAEEEFEYVNEDDRLAREKALWTQVGQDIRVALLETLSILKKKYDLDKFTNAVQSKVEGKPAVKTA